MIGWNEERERIYSGDSDRLESRVTNYRSRMIGCSEERGSTVVTMTGWKLALGWNVVVTGGNGFCTESDTIHWLE